MHDPRARGQARQLFEHDDRRRQGSSAPSGSEAPVNGHQNTSVFAHAAESTSPQNAPMGRHSRRRRRSRGLPIVSSITATSSATLPSSVWPYASAEERQVDGEREQRAGDDEAVVDAGALEHEVDEQHRESGVPEQHALRRGRGRR